MMGFPVTNNEGQSSCVGRNVYECSFDVFAVFLSSSIQLCVSGS